MNRDTLHIDRYYAKYVSETADEVVVVENMKHITLDRRRMYNSYIDTKGYLYTDYAEKEYEMLKAGKGAYKLGVPEKRVQKTYDRTASGKKSWETRRNNGK